MSKVAVFTLTRDRLKYTKKCFASLQQKAGTPYYHLVVDNGSLDGSAHWLKKQKEKGLIHDLILNDQNVGIHKACNQALEVLLKKDFDFIIKFDNDCLVVSDDLISNFVAAYSYFPDKKVFLGPEVYGKRTIPKHSGATTKDNFIFKKVHHLDGMCLVVPTTFYRNLNFKFDENMAFARGADSLISSVGKRSGYKLFRIGNLAVEHFETTPGQATRFPEYFARKKVEETLSPQQTVISSQLVSVIIPTYNCAKYLTPCINSILTQTHKDLEIIVVDDGSTDNTQQILNSFEKNEKVTILKHDVNLGANTARNLGMSRAKGKFLIVVDADSVAYSTMLQEMLDHFKKNPYASYVYCNFDRQGEVKTTHRAGPFSFSRLRKSNFIDMMSLVRTDHMIKFDPKIKRLQDWDLWLSLARHKKIGVFLNRTLYMKHVRSDGISGSKSELSYTQAAQVVRRKHKVFFDEKLQDVSKFNPLPKNLGASVSNYKEKTKIQLPELPRNDFITTRKPKNTSRSFSDLVSIIIATSGNSRDLQRCLDFIYTQTHLNLEILVVVNNTQTKKTITQHIRNARIIYCNGFNLTQAFNKGLSMARGRYALLLTDRITLSSSAIRDFLDAIRLSNVSENSKIKVCFGRTKFPLDGGIVASPEFTISNIAENKIPICGLFTLDSSMALPEVPDKFISSALWFSLLSIYGISNIAVCTTNKIVATAYTDNVKNQQLPKILEHLKVALEHGKSIIVERIVQEERPQIPSFKKVDVAVPNNTSFDIIVCTYNNAPLTIACFSSIEQYTTYDYTLYWVDNASSKDEREKVHNFLKSSKINYVPILNNKNLGFVKGNNLALSRSSAPYVVLLNNDTRVTPNWLEKMYYVFKLHSKAGIVGPITSTGGSWQGASNVIKRFPQKFKKLPIHLLHNELAFNNYLEEKYLHQNIKVGGMVAFFCTLFKRTLFDTVGTLDEQFGVGFCDDDDLCLRARKAGYEVYLTCDTYIYHHHRSTFKKIYPNYRHMQMKNLDLFKKKHDLNSRVRKRKLHDKKITKR